MPTATDKLAWVEMWKMDYRRWPEKVRVLKVTDNYWLEEGQEHTNYKGGYFATPEAAFDHAAEDAERSIRDAARRKQDLATARENFFKKHRRSS